MKLQITQENLNKALSNVARIASTRNSLPILSNILIKTVDNRVCIAATNLNIAITHYIGSKVSEAGSITVPARLMQDFVSSLSPGVIDIVVEETKLHIKTNTFNSTINGIPAEDYPVMPKIKGGKTWNVSSSTFKKALSQVVVAASNDDTRPILTGVYLHTHGGDLYAVATDSYRLAERKVIALKEEVSLLIPATAIQDLLRIIDDGDQLISVTHDDQQVLFTIGDVELVTRLIEGAYPDYRKLIPVSFKTSASLPRGELQNITKVSSLFARESAGSVTIKVDKTEKQISIQSIASQLGENTAKAGADVEGEGSITLNSRYILDALNVIADPKVTISFNDKLEPCVIKGTDKNYTHIIMPLKS
jgi:DNA polymerase III subunit beta